MVFLACCALDIHTKLLYTVKNSTNTLRFLYKYWDLLSANSPNKNSLSLTRSNLIGRAIFSPVKNIVWPIRSLVRSFLSGRPCEVIGHFWVPLCLCCKASLSRRNHSYENDFELHENEAACRTHFHMKGFALRLVLKQRHKRTRKWPIGVFRFGKNRNGQGHVSRKR